jgi:hypothetical protein
LLIADDVWVSGLSMRHFIAGRAIDFGWYAFGIVVVNRGHLDPGVRSILDMNGTFEKATYFLES